MRIRRLMRSEGSSWIKNTHVEKEMNLCPWYYHFHTINLSKFPKSSSYSQSWSRMGDGRDGFKEVYCWWCSSVKILIPLCWYLSFTFIFMIYCFACLGWWVCSWFIITNFLLLDHGVNTTPFCMLFDVLVIYTLYFFVYVWFVYLLVKTYSAKNISIILI